MLARNLKSESEPFCDGGHFRRYPAAPGSRIDTKYSHFFEWWCRSCYGMLSQRKGQEGWKVGITMCPTGWISDEDRKFGEAHSFDSREEALAWIDSVTKGGE